MPSFLSPPCAFGILPVRTGAYTPPCPPTSKLQPALPHSSAPPIAGWHIEFSPIHTTPLLRPFSGTSTLLRVVPPLGSASVLSLSWFFHLSFSVNIGTAGSHVPLNRRPTDSGHLHAGCRFGPDTGFAEACPASTTLRGLDFVHTFST